MRQESINLAILTSRIAAAKFEPHLLPGPTEPVKYEASA